MRSASPIILFVVGATFATGCVEGAGALDRPQPPDARVETDGGVEADGGVDAGALGLRLVPDPSRVDVGGVELGGVARFELRLRVEGGSIDVRSLTFTLEDGPGWTLEARPAWPGGPTFPPGSVVPVACTLHMRSTRPLDGSIRVDYPRTESPQVELRARPASSPFELYDPEDIGFGAVGITGSPTVLAHFSSPVAIPPGVPSGVFVDPVEPPVYPEGTSLRLFFAPLGLGAHTFGLDVAGRAVPVHGRRARTALRALPRLVDLGEVPPDGCATATISLGNPGLGQLVGRLALETAPWSTAEPETLEPVPLDPLESRLVSVRVCGSRTGLFGATIEDPAGLPVVQLGGRVRGGELAARGPLPAGALVVGMPKVVTATLTNPGLRPVEVTGVEVVGDHAGDGRVVGASAFTIPAKGTGTIRVELVPSGSGARRLGLRVRSSDPARSIVDVPIRGTAERLDCNLTFDRDDLQLGASADERPRTHVSLRNGSGSACALLIPDPPSSALTWNGPPPGEPWDAGRRRLRLEPGARAALPLSPARAVNATLQTSIDLWSAASERPALRRQIPVSAALHPDLLSLSVEVEPECVDDLTREAALKLRMSASTTEIEVLGIDVRAFRQVYLPSLPALPFTLRPGGEAMAALSITGASSGPQPVEVAVTYRVGAGTFSLRRLLNLEFSPSPETRDRFQALGRPKVDLLWVVEGSGSIGDIASVEANVLHLSQYVAANAEAQIAFTSAVEGGLLAPPRAALILDPAVSDIESEVPRYLDHARGVSAGQLEQPLDAARLAIDEWRAQGSLRDDAILGVVVVTDEDDASPGSVDEAVDALHRVKGFRNTNLISLSAVAGPEGCRLPATASPVPRLRAAVEGTGGVLVSPCTADWGRSLEWGSVGTPAPRRFFLTNQPREDRIRVFVDDAEVPRVNADGSARWRYDFATNSITFAPTAPVAPASQIEVRYPAECL